MDTMMRYIWINYCKDYITRYTVGEDKIHESGKIQIHNTDITTFSDAEGFDIIFDRASLMALNIDQRETYSKGINIIFNRNLRLLQNVAFHG